MRLTFYLQKICFANSLFDVIYVIELIKETEVKNKVKRKKNHQTAFYY